jgi:hypothetical protein
MATLLQDEGVIEVRVVLLGSAQATQTLWERMERFTRTRQDDMLVIPERRTSYSPVGPLSEHLFRVEVQRLTLDDMPPTQKLVEQLSAADGILLAVDVTQEEASLTREIVRITEQAMALLDPSGWLRARALLGISGHRMSGGEPPPLWTELRMWWHRLSFGDWTCSSLTAQVDDEFTGEALYAVSSRMRQNFSRRPPALHPIYPQSDLPDEARADAERHQKNLRRAEPDIRADAFLNLAMLYGQAGQVTAAKVLLRRAFETHRATKLWDNRPPGRPPVTALERLREWELPKAQVGDIAFLPGGETLLVATGKTLLKCLRHAEAFDELWRFDYDVRRLLPIDGQRMVVVHDHLMRLLAFEGDLTTRAEAALPTPLKELLARQRDPRMLARAQALGDGTFKPFSLEVRADAKGDRLLLSSRAGVWLYRLSDLKPLAKIERTDILDAAFCPQAPGVWTLHDQGMVGLWTPGSSVLERVANLPARLKDGSLSDAGFAVGLAEGSASTPVMMVSLRTGQRHGEGAATVNATSVKVSASGERVLSIEERYLRVRDSAAAPLGPQTPTRSLLTPPPWVPARIAWSEGERQIAALCKPYILDSDDPLRVYLWA